MADTNPIDNLIQIAKAFQLPGELKAATRITKGRINTAYCVTLTDGDSSRDYLFQRVNTYVFSDPESLMRNISLITEHIAAKSDPTHLDSSLNSHSTPDDPLRDVNCLAAGQIPRTDNCLSPDQTPCRYNCLSPDQAPCRYNCLRFHTTSDGALFYTPPGTDECWRVSNYIGNSVSFEPAEAGEKAVYMVGKAYGKFNRDLADFDASRLTATIPHFHDTVLRLQTLSERIEEDPLGRAKSAAPEIQMIRALTEKSEPALDLIKTSDLPLHATHNDTKMNNVLLDKDTLEPLAVIDLDTCMPGLYCYDFGDMIRSAASTGDEEGITTRNETTSASATDSCKVSLNLTRFRTCTEGYMSEMKGIIKESEIDSLPCGVIAATLELAARFLEDHLSGDIYFRTDRPGQNLDRARTQLHLLDDILTHFDDMKQLMTF